MTDNADEPDHHGGNKGNQTTINSVSKKRKADSDIVEPDSDIESTSKKQKSASGVDDPAVVNREDGMLLSREGKERVHRMPQISKRKGSAANNAKADETGNLHHITFLHSSLR